MSKTDKEIAEAWGASGRIRSGMLQTLQRIDVSLDGLTMRQTDETLRKMSRGMSQARLRIIADKKYGDPFAYTVIEGWRDVSAAERAIMVEKIEQRERAIKAKEDADILHLRRVRPELFK